MGCDIHAMVEIKKDRWWANAGDPGLWRDYELFAFLADVRNDYDIVPISQPKGVPDDCCSEYSGWIRDWGVGASKVI